LDFGIVKIFGCFAKAAHEDSGLRPLYLGCRLRDDQS
jgi:hypothetical protein